MPIVRKSLADFLSRLDIEGPVTKFTWLIGAGMSATSGIPLANGISKRIILFEYIIQVLKYRPWDLENKKRIRYQNKDDLNDFLEWFEIKEQEQNEGFIQHSIDAGDWLKTHEEFKNTSFDSPDCYQKLFEKFLMGSVTHHTFLTAIVRKTKGVNLSHLGLAGILRDQKEWGDTVFTTNFDDLLLTAILSLGYTARVFGDLNSTDTPVSNPDYPQIVHLHGRHTGYNLLNTENETSLFFDERLQSSFREQISTSNLIVLGYSGWDDLVKYTLEKWPTEKNLMQGNLYWIPYKNSDSIRRETYDFLDSLPNNKVIIIENEEKSLDADSFILALAETLNIDNGGFREFRKDLLSYAKNQHEYILEELKRYPEHNPERIHSYLIEAHDKLISSENLQANLKLDDAVQIIDSDDLPIVLRAPSCLKIGILSNLLNKQVQAEKYLKASLDLSGILKNQFGRTKEIQSIEAQSLLALGEFHLKVGELDKALEFIKKGRYKFYLSNNKLGEAYSNLAFAQVMITLNKLNTLKDAEYAISEVETILTKFNDDFGLVVFNKSLGEILLRSGRKEQAEVHFRKALDLTESINYEILYAHILKGLTKSLIEQGKIEDALESLNKANVVYEKCNDQKGLANVHNSNADIHFFKNDIMSAKLEYENAYRIFLEIDSKLGVGNALGDILKCNQLLKSPNEEINWINTAEDFLLTNDHSYLQTILKETLEDARKI